MISILCIALAMAGAIPSAARMSFPSAGRMSPSSIKKKCTVHSGPHLKTWKDVYYDITTNCTSDMVLISANENRINMHARFKPMSGISQITNVGMGIDEDILEVFEDGTHKINGQLSGLHTSSIGGYPLTVVSNADAGTKVFEVSLDDGDYVRITNWRETLSIEISVRSSPSAFQDTVGLCGNWENQDILSRDDTSENQDTLSRNGTSSLDLDVDSLVQGWKVATSDHQVLGALNTSVVCAPPSTVNIQGAGAVDLMRAGRVCGHVFPSQEKDNCILDFLMTRDTSWAMAPYYNEDSYRNECSAGSSNLSSGCAESGGECVPVSSCNVDTNSCIPELCGTSYMEWDVVRPCVCSLPRRAPVQEAIPTEERCVAGSKASKRCKRNGGECVPVTTCNESESVCDRDLCDSRFVNTDVVGTCVCEMPMPHPDN